MTDHRGLKVLHLDIREIVQGSWALGVPVSINLAQGQGLVLKGPNGSGKTSILRVAAGLYPFEGIFQTRPQPEFCRLKGCSLDGPLDLSVSQHLAFWAQVYQGSPRELEERKHFYGLLPYMSRRLHQLSHGMAHRVGLARMGLGKASLWLMDEPFSGLDRQTQETLKQDITHFQKNGGSVLMASHENPMGWDEISLPEPLFIQNP